MNDNENDQNNEFNMCVDIDERPNSIGGQGQEFDQGLSNHSG